MKKRNFKTIYFPYKDKHGNNVVKNVSVAFNNTNEKDLYKKIKKISTTEIKKIISIFSYNQLIQIAEKEERKITELIKLRLKENFTKSQKYLKRTVLINKRKIKKWNERLVELNKNDKYITEIINFFEELV